MSFLPAHRAGNPGLYYAWTPLNLGASLLAWWDAERSDLITQSGGAVSSWKDIVGGYDLAQSVGASKPTYSATSFNGRPGIAPDRTDDYLELSTGLTWLPAGATPSEDWYLVDQNTDAAITQTQALGAWGSTNNGNSRLVLRVVSSGVNRAEGLVANTVIVNGSVDFSGRHVVRQVTGATVNSIEVDGVASSPSSVIPTTTATRIRMFANAVSSPSSFAGGIHSARLITSLLTADQATQLYAYLNRRL